MRCPKCGYNSFDHLKSCKKCGKDLKEHKSRFGIKSFLLTGTGTEAGETVGTEEFIETAIAPELEENLPQPAIEAPVTAAESDDFGFDFIGGNEEETPAFDELFDETSLEDDVDETLPAPANPAETLLNDGLDDPSAFDFGETESLEPNFSLDEPENPAEEIIPETDLDFDDETDLVDFDDDDTLGTMEDPKSPFDCEEALQIEDPPALNSSNEIEGPAEELPGLPPIDPQPLADDPFVAGENSQDKLFTTDQEQPFESFEASFGESSFDNSAVGVSDSFALGALPTTGFSDIQEAEATESQATAESPESSLEELSQTEETGTVPPPFSRRISAFFCDIILIGLVGFCFILVAETALSESSQGIFPSPETLIDLSIPYFLVIFFLTFGYFTLFHFLTGQTPGKMITGIRVETSSGEVLAFSQAFMRSVGGLIQLLPAGLGYLSVLLDQEGRGWNDRLAGTRMVDLKDLPEKLVN